jgi:deoxycytidine triphosphate deaminase
MVLIDQEISDLHLVIDPVQVGRRFSTYDATVGQIISEGEIIDADSFTLPKRGIVWVVSNEQFALPNNITGLATLRTTWTHKGVLALNLGIIDPGWSGPLSTALVNFGNGNFRIAKGDPFFRIMFHQHAPTQAQPQQMPPVKNYVDGVVDKSRLFSKTFLGMESLIHEVSDEVLAFPRWALTLTVVAVVVSILAIYMPIAYTVGEEAFRKKHSNAERIEQLEKDVKLLQTQQKDSSLTPPLQNSTLVPSHPLPAQSPAQNKP